MSLKGSRVDFVERDDVQGGSILMCSPDGHYLNNDFSELITTSRAELPRGIICLDFLKMME